MGPSSATLNGILLFVASYVVYSGFSSLENSQKVDVFHVEFSDKFNGANVFSPRWNSYLKTVCFLI